MGRRRTGFLFRQDGLHPSEIGSAARQAGSSLSFGALIAAILVEAAPLGEAASSGDSPMKSIIIASVLWAAHTIPSAPARAESSVSLPASQAAQGRTEDFFDARGHLIGSLTMIGNVSYYTTPDGKVIGVATIVDGHRIYRSY